MRRVFLLLLAVSLLAACSPNSTQPTPTLTLAATDTPQPTLTPSRTPALTSTATTAPTATPLTCWQDGGLLVSDLVPSQVLGEDIALLIYLPPCFFARPDAQYPTLYLIHGQSFNQDQWVRLGITETADALIANGEAAPFLIVMPYVSDWSQPTEFPFGQAMAEEILPYIEAGYRAYPLQAARAVGGLSRGGSWALHLGTRYWDLFGILGGHSAPVFLDDDTLIYSWLEQIPPGQAPRIYLDIATSDQGDIRKSVVWFASLLDRLGIPYQLIESTGYHSESYWGAHIEEYLRFYTADWRP